MNKLMLLITIFTASCGGNSYPYPAYQGKDGYNSLINKSESGTVLCASNGIMLSTGLDTNRNNVLDLTEVESISVICNGDTSTTGATSVVVIDPCGDSAGIVDEVFLKLSNGILLKSFSDNGNAKTTRFSVVTQGDYVTNDGSSCYFSVDNNGDIYNERY